MLNMRYYYPVPKSANRISVFHYNMFGLAAVDAVGTEFTIFFQENAARRVGFTFELQIFLTTHSDLPVTVQVELPLVPIDGRSSRQEVIVTKGNVTEVNFPQNQMHIGSGVSNK